MMREHHVIARIRPNGSVLMQHVISPAPFGKEVHQLTFQVSDSLVVVIWWPERLTPAMETAQSEACIQNLKERLQSNKWQPGDKP